MCRVVGQSPGGTQRAGQGHAHTVTAVLEGLGNLLSHRLLAAKVRGQIRGVEIQMIGPTANLEVASSTCLRWANTHDRTEPLTPLRQGFHSLHIGLGMMGSEIGFRGERSGFGQRHAAADAELIRGLRAEHHAEPAVRITRMQDHRATFKLGLSDDQTLYGPTGQPDADDTLHGDNSRYASRRSLHRFPTQSFHHCEPAGSA